MKFVESSLSGLRAYPEGLRWLSRHPFYLLLLLLPFFLSLAALFWGWSGLREVDVWLAERILFPEPQQWWMYVVWWICQWILYLAVRILALVIAMLFANALWAPVYEWVSCAVEKDFTGGRLVEVSFWRSILLITEELKKVFFIIAVSLIFMFIPFLNVFSFFMTALLIGWNFFDFPLARRGWSFQRRLGFVWQNKWSVGGFGLWMMIPFLQMFLFPFAVVGGTLVSLRALREQGLLDLPMKQVV